ncbi:hypothetical protein KIW84_020159 [Lathyrus oleraceus]|uniref:Uncharacterized protein n=1 Tax=Pisum sativum TaxID=3888 RepID=A0A9D4Y5L5_PEA|nr:hypothetical protein KIW84_020159 [Pisum sativum]
MAAFTKARVAVAKIFRIIDHKLGIDRNSESGLELETVTGLVELKNVDFSYPSRPEVKILNDFSLNVPAVKNHSFTTPCKAIECTDGKGEPVKSLEPMSTPLGYVSTPSRLMSATPALKPPKRHLMTPGRQFCKITGQVG